MRYTKMEMLLEFFEDLYDKFPEKMREFLSSVGDTAIPITGDPVIDKWTAQLDRGETPNFDEFFPAGYDPSKNTGEGSPSPLESITKPKDLDDIVRAMDNVIGGK